MKNNSNNSNNYNVLASDNGEGVAISSQLTPTPENETSRSYTDCNTYNEGKYIGHLRGYWGKDEGRYFHSVWFGDDSNKPERFNEKFDNFINTLREKGGLLYSYDSFCNYCKEKGNEVEDYMRYNYQFTAEREGVKYYIRCNTHIGDYNFYVYAYEIIG